MTGNLAPRELAVISKAVDRLRRGGRLQDRLSQSVAGSSITPTRRSPGGGKIADEAVGLPAGDLRKPLTNLEGEALAKGLRIVQELGLDKRYGYRVKALSAVAA